jgi:dUTP pyrophosphatase
MLIIEPGERVKLPTGIYCEIPKGNYGEIDTRSSTSKLLLLPLCRTIDSDYRGNIHVVLTNVGKDPQVVKRGDYLAQMIVKPYTKVKPNKVGSREELSSTERAENGFGHTTEKRKGINGHG